MQNHMLGNWGIRTNGIAMIGQAVAYIASAFKMAARKESFLAQRVYE